MVDCTDLPEPGRPLLIRSRGAALVEHRFAVLELDHPRHTQVEQRMLAGSGQVEPKPIKTGRTGMETSVSSAWSSSLRLASPGHARSAGRWTLTACPSAQLTRPSFRRGRTPARARDRRRTVSDQTRRPTGRGRCRPCLRIAAPDNQLTNWPSFMSTKMISSTVVSTLVMTRFLVESWSTWRARSASAQQNRPVRGRDQRRGDNQDAYVPRR